MKLFNAKSMTETLATDTRMISAQNLKGYAMDLLGDAGYKATAADFYKLLGGNGGVYSKILIMVISHPEIQSLAVTKLGCLYSLSVLKSNGLEYHSASATKLINLVINPRTKKDDAPSAGSSDVVTNEVITCIKKAIKEYGRNTTVKNVFNRLNREAYFVNGTLYRHHKDFSIRFNKSGPLVTVTLTDGDGFRQDLTSASELQKILGSE